MKLRINFKAVVVIIFGLFSLYVYFRLVYPYLNAASFDGLVSADIFSRRVTEIDGEKYSYWTNGVKNPRKIVVMLPPSTDTGDYFGRYAKILPKDVLIIAPDYPGRGLTSGIADFDTVPLLSHRVAILLKHIIGKKSFDMVGPSFGGMIGTQLVRDKDLKIDKLFLIATGEFFAPDQKFMYGLLFYPATVSENMRLKYVDFLIGGNFFSNVRNSNIRDILEQWLTLLDYKIDTGYQSNVPAIIIVFNRDNVVQPESEAKLEEVFINHKVINIDFPHKSESFFSPELQRILNINI